MPHASALTCQYDNTISRHFISHSEVWAYLGNSSKLPIYGWKVHVSFSEKWAVSAALTIAEICNKHSLHCKIAKSLLVLSRINSGSFYPTQQIGKIATIYFPNAQVLYDLHVELTQRLKYTGPPVLTDRKIKSSNCLYVRYSNFFIKKNEKPISTHPSNSDIKLLSEILETAPPSVPSRFTSIRPVRVSGKGLTCFAFDSILKKEIFLKLGFYHGYVEPYGPSGAELVQREEASFLLLTECSTVRTPVVLDSMDGKYGYSSVREIIQGPNLQDLLSSGSDKLLARTRDLIVTQLKEFFDFLSFKNLKAFDLSPANFVFDSQFQLHYVDAEYILEPHHTPPATMTFLSKKEWSVDLQAMASAERFEYEKERLFKFVRCDKEPVSSEN